MATSQEQQRSRGACPLPVRTHGRTLHRTPSNDAEAATERWDAFTRPLRSQDEGRPT